MLFRDQRSTSATHPFKVRRISSQSLGHRIYERLDSPGRNQPTVDALFDQLGVSCYIRTDNRTPQRQRLEENSGKPFGKTRQHRRRAARSSSQTP